MSATIQTISTIRDLRSAIIPWRQADQRVAIVPTMGALHRGHMALIAAAREVVPRVVATIFVNPLQFAPSEDMTRYPRPFERDQQMLADAGCDLLFAPSPADIYPQGFSSQIDPGPLGQILEGRFRPGHFSGVATVVTKLLLQTMPDAAFFGEKDYQQLQVIKRVTRDLDIPIHIIGVPTVREDDGLALSSRNVYLSQQERIHAAILPRVMRETARRIMTGDAVHVALQDGVAHLTDAGYRVDYLEFADAQTLGPLQMRDAARPARLLVAAYLGKTRLIDNFAV